jgi:hypothetical protein
MNTGVGTSPDFSQRLMVATETPISAATEARETKAPPLALFDTDSSRSYAFGCDAISNRGVL